MRRAITPPRYCLRRLRRERDGAGLQELRAVWHPTAGAATGACEHCSVFKQFQVMEKLKLQFRAEAFNSLNRVRFSGPNTNVTAGANFGRVTAQSNDPRQLQFGMKLIW